MAKKRKPVEYLHLFGKITNQEVHFGSRGGDPEHPFRVGTHIELSAVLDKPIKDVSTVEISIDEREQGDQGSRHVGMVFRTKPVIYVGVWAEAKACDRLLAVIAAQRLTDLYLVIEPPRYGKAWVLSWQVRTAPEPD
jgi:hypothetical protein